MFSYTGKMRSRYSPSASVITLETLTGEPVTMPSPPIISNGYITLTVETVGKYRVRVRTPYSHFSYQIEVTNSSPQVDISPSPKAVVVSTGNESRPAGSEFVMWIGGATKPVNMQNNDIWFKSEATVPPVTGDTIQHSIWGTTPYPYTLTKDTGQPITVANLFYSYGTSPDVNAWRVIGAKIWVPAGASVSGPLAVMGWGAGVPITAPATATASIASPAAGQWNTAYFNTPIETSTSDIISVGYRYPNGDYFGAPSPTGDFVAALDGSHIVLANEYETSGRGRWKYDGGGSTATTSVYGVDVIYGEGAV